MEQRAQCWKLLQSLQGERILNGTESSSVSLSQSLWSISLMNGLARGRRSLTNSNDSLLRKRESSPSHFGRLTRTMSVDPDVSKGGTFPRHLKRVHNDISRLFDGNLTIARTSSLGRLLEGPKKTSPTTPHLLHTNKRHSTTTIGESSQELDLVSLRNIHASPVSDDSGTESGNTSVDELSHPASHSIDVTGNVEESSGVIAHVSQNDTKPSLSGKDLEELELSQEKATKMSTSSIESTPPMPLKSILRVSNQSSREENRSSTSPVGGFQLEAPMNRVSSDDSGIAMKPLSSTGTDLEQSNTLIKVCSKTNFHLSNSMPTPVGGDSYYNNSVTQRPKKHVRLLIRSNSETMLLSRAQDKHVQTRQMTIASVHEISIEKTNIKKNCEDFSEDMGSLKPDETRPTKPVERKVSNMESVTEPNASVSLDGFVRVQWKVTDVDTDEDKEIKDITSSKPDPVTKSSKPDPISKSPKPAPSSKERRSLCRQKRTEGIEKQADTLTVDISKLTVSTPPLKNETKKDHQRKTSLLGEDKRDVTNSIVHKKSPPELDNAVQKSSQRVAPPDRANKTSSNVRSCTIHKQHSGTKVQELVKAFDSSAIQNSIGTCTGSTSPKRTTSQSQIKTSKLPISHTRKKTIDMPFTRQYAKRYNDNVSSKSNKSTTDKSPVREPRTACKRQSTSPSSKPVSHRSASKITLSPSQTQKGSEPQQSIGTRRKSTVAITSKPSDSHSVKTLSASPKHGHSTRWISSTKYKDSSVDSDKMSKAVTLSPRIQTTRLSEHHRANYEGKLTVEQAKQACREEKKPFEPTLDLSNSVHSANSFSTAKATRLLKSVSVAVSPCSTYNRLPRTSKSVSQIK